MVILGRVHLFEAMTVDLGEVSRGRNGYLVDEV